MIKGPWSNGNLRWAAMHDAVYAGQNDATFARLFFSQKENPGKEKTVKWATKDKWTLKASVYLTKSMQGRWRLRVQISPGPYNLFRKKIDQKLKNKVE